MRSIARYQQANQTYLEEGVRLLDVARRAADLFAAQPPTEKRRLFDFVLSSRVWKDGELTATYRQPFDLLAVAKGTWQEKKAAGLIRGGLRLEMLPELDSNQQPSD
jgi:hypothetical protein